MRILLDEQSCRISPRAVWNDGALAFFKNDRPSSKNNKMSSDMRSLPDIEIDSSNQVINDQFVVAECIYRWWICSLVNSCCCYLFIGAAPLSTLRSGILCSLHTAKSSSAASRLRIWSPRVWRLRCWCGCCRGWVCCLLIGFKFYFILFLIITPSVYTSYLDKKNLQYYRHNFNKLRHSFVIFDTNHSDTPVY